jgi:hypothetical protein
MLRLILVSAQELNKESGELFGSTPQALAGEKWAKYRVFGNARVKGCGQAPATLLPTKCLQQCTTRAHGRDCILRYDSLEIKATSPFIYK